MCYVCVWLFGCVRRVFVVLLLLFCLLGLGLLFLRCFVLVVVCLSCSVCCDVMKATIAYAGDKKEVTPKPRCKDPRTKQIEAWRLA